jgi:hypothetical protein
MKAWFQVALLAAGLCSAVALAEADSFGLGSGRDGPLTVTSPGTVINRYAQVMGPVAPGDNVLLVAGTEGFAAGDLVMVLQVTGLVPEPVPGAPGPIDLSDDAVGRWELARLAAVGEGMLTLTAPVVHSYAAQVTQIIRVPEYTHVRIQRGASLRAVPWNGGTGGVVAFLATGTVHNEGEISATGAGFRGGRYVPDSSDPGACAGMSVAVRPAARKGEGIAVTQYGPTKTGRESVSNGGGGGVCPMAGGGGGGNGGAGGRGGSSVDMNGKIQDVGGQGGSKLLYSLLDRLSFGGGGGSGHGEDWLSSGAGAGGGAIFIHAYRLSGRGGLVADGEAGGSSSSGGASGGGAGGSIHLQLTDSAECGSISARGGMGGDRVGDFLMPAGAGGGGGGGRVLLRAGATGVGCPLHAEAGLGGVQSNGHASTLLHHEARPVQAELGLHAGIIKQLTSPVFEMAQSTLSVSGLAASEPCKGNALEVCVPATGAVVKSVRPEISGTYKVVPGSVVNVLIDGNQVTGAATIDSFNGTWRYTLVSDLSQGQHKVQAKTSMEASPEIIFTVDTLGPVVSITGHPQNPTRDPSATFHFSANEDRSSFLCSLDGAGYASCSSPITYNNLAHGPHTFSVKAVDAHGNDGAPVPYEWLVDSKGPDVRILSGPDAPTTQQSASFTFESSEAGARYQCSLDGGAYVSCSSPSTYGGLGHGSHAFSVQALDSLGNAGPAANRTWFVDLQGPVLKIESGPSNPTKATNATFVFSSNELATYQCALDGAAFVSCLNTESYTGLAVGSHSFSVKGTDVFGHVGATLTYTWVVDQTPPDTRIDSGPATPTNLTSATFTFSSTESGSSYECALDSGSFVSCGSPKTYSGLEAGSHTFYVRATDAAGNVDGSAASHVWLIDTTAPSTRIDSGPPALTNLTTATFQFSSNETVTYECALDGATYTPCSTPKAYSGLGNGSHSFSVKARDVAGNESTPVTHTWSIDTTEPSTRIDSGPPALTKLTTATFRFSSSETVTYECALDGAAYTPCSTPKNYDTLGDGSHTFNVRAIDEAGNVDATPAAHVWSVDSVAPDTQIVSSPSPRTNLREAEFSFSSTGGSVFYECSLDTPGTDKPFEVCTSPVKYTGLGDGTYTFAVRAVDEAGNADASPAQLTWVVDNVRPIVEIEEPLNGGVVSTRTPVIRGTVNKVFRQVRVFIDSRAPVVVEESGGMGWALVVSPGLSNGPHTVSAEATDLAGNTGARSATVTFTVDTDPPDTRIVEAPPKVHNSRIAAFVFESPDGAAEAFECLLDAATRFTPCEATHVFTRLTDGDHTLQVRAKDSAGNVDPTPEVYQWTVVIQPPPSPEVTDPADGAVVDTGTPAISGRAVPRSTVTIYIDGQKSGVAQADDSGLWTFRPPTPLDEGEHTLTTETTDEAGNTSAQRSLEQVFSILLPKGEARAIGGGLSCASSGGGAPPAWLLLGSGLWLLRRRRRC